MVVLFFFEIGKKKLNDTDSYYGFLIISYYGYYGLSLSWWLIKSMQSFSPLKRPLSILNYIITEQ